MSGEGRGARPSSPEQQNELRETQKAAFAAFCVSTDKQFHGEGRSVRQTGSLPRENLKRPYLTISFTPACSSMSSFSVKSIFSREKASISSPFTRSYLPGVQVTGTPYIVPSGMP